MGTGVPSLRKHVRQCGALQAVKHCRPPPGDLSGKGGIVNTYVYVQASDGTPLMPTKRKHHVQKLLKRGKAVVVEHVPFVVRLKYKAFIRGHRSRKDEPRRFGDDV